MFFIYTLFIECIYYCSGNFELKLDIYGSNYIT